MNYPLEIHLFNGSYQSLAEQLKANGIEFSERHQFSAAPATAQVVLELAGILKTAAPWASLAAVLIAWLKNRAGRKVIITTKDQGTIHVEGMSITEVERILEKTQFVSAIESRNEESA
ncbi:hypothetical protein B0F87_10735 [Methylobacter tundripaludum]|uniref:Uncharacterized protein n=1 Tax=Methylobacter tundripaludum TaxID=173365 RepID=A0A2S6HBG3_9GAMM|nr:hypothetical protein [Methylobacter tundripaludum]PPK74792.1 hypothetical protein B0F87_10735 [Methylobacter tundripaludum]